MPQHKCSDLPILTYPEWDSSNCPIQCKASEWLQNLPSSEGHIPSNPQRRVDAVGTTAGHHSKSLHIRPILLRGRRLAVVGMLFASQGKCFRVNYEGLASRQTKDLLLNFLGKVNKLPLYKTLKLSLWLCMGSERLCMDYPSRPQDSLKIIFKIIVYAML